MNPDEAAPAKVVDKYPEVKKLGNIAKWNKAGMKMKHPLALAEYLGVSEFKKMRATLKRLGFKPRDASLFNPMRGDEYKTGEKSSIWESTAGFCNETNPKKWKNVY